jgi:hypothetical protein
MPNVEKLYAIVHRMAHLFFQFHYSIPCQPSQEQKLLLDKLTMEYGYGPYKL